jgi:hypothetical protein
MSLAWIFFLVANGSFQLSGHDRLLQCNSGLDISQLQAPADLAKPSAFESDDGFNYNTYA